MKTAVKNVKYHRGPGVPCTHLMINQGGGKKLGGGKHRGVHRTPLILTGGVATPLDPP